MTITQAWNKFSKQAREITNQHRSLKGMHLKRWANLCLPHLLRKEAANQEAQLMETKGC